MVMFQCLISNGCRRRPTGDVAVKCKKKVHKVTTCGWEVPPKRPRGRLMGSGRGRGRGRGSGADHEESEPDEDQTYEDASANEESDIGDEFSEDDI